MSRQTNFLHSEADIYAFLQAVESCNGVLVYNGKSYEPLELTDIVIKNMELYFSRFLILPKTQFVPDLSIEPADVSVWKGKAIEFLNCTKGSSESIEYRIGRIYLRKTEEYTYSPDLSKLYTKLSSFIKKQYRYSKPCSVYFSPDFLEKSTDGILIGKGDGKIRLYFDRVTYI